MSTSTSSTSTSSISYTSEYMYKNEMPNNKIESNNDLSHEGLLLLSEIVIIEYTECWNA
jgi:hypothetical protein